MEKLSGGISVFSYVDMLLLAFWTSGWEEINERPSCDLRPDKVDID